MLGGGRRDTGSGGGTPHGESITRAQLLSKRNSNSLEVGVTYLIPYSRGTIGSAEISLVATATNELAKGGWANVSFDNSAWECEYDIDANRMTAMQDNRDNEVRGQNIVETFPWGNTAVNRNTISNAAVINYTAGNFNDNVIDSRARVTINSGNFERNNIGQEANVAVTSSDFRNNVIESDATVTATTTGDVEQNLFGNACTATISDSANLDDSRIRNQSTVNLSGTSQMTNTVTSRAVVNLTNAGQSLYNNIDRSTVNISGGNLQSTVVESNCTVTITIGVNVGNNFSNDTTVNQVGSGYIRYSHIAGNATLTNGNTNIEDVDCWNTSINTTGSSGGIINCRFHNATLTARNVVLLDLQYLSMENASSFSVENAQRTYVRYTQLSGAARLLQSAGTQLDCDRLNIFSSGYVQVTAGRLYASYSTVMNNSYIQHTSTGTNRIYSTVVSNNSRALFNNTVDGCRIYYCQINSGAYMQHRDASVNCYIYYSTSTDQSQFYTRGSTNARIYYCSATGAGILYSQGNTTTHYIYYCTATARGYVVALNNTAIVRLYALHASSVAQIRLQNTTVNSNLYYSSVAAYYYAYITLTGGTRSALHGYGRRSYTVTNPPNGSYVQNF